MYCKYCGSKIADDSVFCVKCGKSVVDNEINVAHKEKEVDGNSIRIQLMNIEKSIWKSTDDLQWIKPIGARILQVILLSIGVFFFFYGIIWYFIIEEKVNVYSHPCSYPYFSRYEAKAVEPLGIIAVFVDLERDDPNFQKDKEKWETLYKYGKLEDQIVKRLCKVWGIDTTLSYSYICLDLDTPVSWDSTISWGEALGGYHLTNYQRFQIHSEIERERRAVSNIPYDHGKYHTKVYQLAISKFRTLTLFEYILPAIIIIVLSIIWIIKITPKSNSKTILPRDLADKIENYTWNGFTLHKYLRFIKDGKYGILDAVTRSIVVSATYDLIEWRQSNKSYDGLINGVKKTYCLTNN